MTIAGQYIYGLSSGMTPDQSERGSNYGDMIDILRGYQAGSNPAPIYAIIEDGQPFTGSTNGSTYITPAELNWATWSSLIHGARGVIYFDHSFSGPGTGNVDVENPYYPNRAARSDDLDRRPNHGNGRAHQATGSRSKFAVRNELCDGQWLPL